MHGNSVIILHFARMEFKKIGFTSPIKSRVVNYSSTSQKPVRPDILRLSAALIIKGTEWGGGGTLNHSSLKSDLESKTGPFRDVST